MKTAGAILLVSFVVARSTIAAATCSVATVDPCVIDLHGKDAPRLSQSCTQDAWKGHLVFELPDRFADADQNGWHEAVLGIDVDPKRGCGCAVFRITYEGEPKGYSVNIGDSPTNDGYGGDDWSTRFDAEIQILHRDLTAFGSERPDAPADLQIFGLRDLPIADRVLELEICDQSVRFTIDPKRDDSKSEHPKRNDSKRKDQKPFSGFFNAYFSRDLIAIRPSGEARAFVESKERGNAGATSDAKTSGTARGSSEARTSKEATSDDQPDSRIYAAFNRVIHRRSGRPAQNRFGWGVRRVEISLTP